MVRPCQRAAADAVERDPRHARAHGGVPLLPELQRAAALPLDDRKQAQSRWYRVVRHRDGAPHLDAARRERVTGSLPSAGPGPECAFLEGAAVARPRLARVPGVDLHLRRDQANREEPARDWEAALPRD